MTEPDARPPADPIRETVAGGRHALALALAVLLACLGVTYASWRELESDARRMAQNAFELRADAAAQRIETRLRRYEQLLRGAAALAAASERLSAREFRAYVDSLQLSETYPEMRAIGLAATVEDAGSTHARVVYLQRSVGFTSLESGADLDADALRRGAMDRARETGGTALSPLIPAADPAGEPRPRFDLFFPVFNVPAAAEMPARENRFSGWMFAEVSVSAMIGRLFGEGTEGLEVRVRDVAPGGPAPEAQPRSTPAGEVVAERRIDFAGHEWSVHVRAPAALAGTAQHRHADLLGVAGIAMSLLLAILVWLLATGSGRARAAAARMNRDLIASEAGLRELNEHLEERVAKRTRELETFAERLALAVQTSNTGLWDWNLLTGEVHYSAEWARQLGVEPQELRPVIEEWETRLHPDDRERAMRALREHMPNPGGTCEMELRLRHRNDTYRTILCRSRSYADASGMPVRVVGSHLDITERKRAEDGLVKLARELRQAWRQLSQVEEADRRWLASELHDTIGSALTALNLNLTIVRERLPVEARPALEPRLRDSIALLDETVEVVRGLMAQLRPPVLDDYGLATAVRWYLDQVACRGSLKANFRLDGEDVRLPAETEIALFRIAQGALTNVVKHSAARHVDVAIEARDKSLRMSIVDDGRGFMTEKAHDDLGSPHWGLVTMRERAESIGGRCTIESSPGRGTRVAVEISTTA